MAFNLLPFAKLDDVYLYFRLLLNFLILETEVKLPQK